MARDGEGPSAELVRFPKRQDPCPHCPHPWHGLACGLRTNGCTCLTSYDGPTE